MFCGQTSGQVCVQGNFAEPKKFPFLTTYNASHYQPAHYSIDTWIKTKGVTGAAFKQLLMEATGIPVDHQQLEYIAVPQDSDYCVDGEERKVEWRKPKTTYKLDLGDSDKVDEVLKKYNYISLTIMPCQNSQHCHSIVTASMMSGQRLPVVLDDTLTVAALQKQIADHFGLPANQQRLIYNGNQISNTEHECSRTLSSFGVKDGEHISIVQRLPKSA